MTAIPKIPPQRIEVIDVIRGFTLFGIALIHMVEQYYAGPPPAEAMSSSSASDGIVIGLVQLLIGGKFFMIFSFLFGLSFYIQLSKANGNESFLLRFSWRLLILFAIGLLHHLHYRGDILSIYALLGFGLLIFYRLPDKALLILSIAFIADVPAIIFRTVQIFYPFGESPFSQNQEVIQAYYETLKHGTYFDILRANFYEFATKMSFQVWSGRLYITFGLFLLGVYAGRKRYFERADEFLSFNRKGMRWAGMIMLFTFLTGIIFFAVLPNVFGLTAPESISMLIGGTLMDLFNAALAFIYVAGIVILFRKPKWRSRLMILYPVGKMGLTVYLLQTLFGTLVFFSYGLGLLFSIGSLYALLLGFGFFIIQIVFARLWLQRFTYGPIEWIWRNLTYLRLQPLAAGKQIGT